MRQYRKEEWLRGTALMPAANDELQVCWLNGLPLERKEDDIDPVKAISALGDRIEKKFADQETESKAAIERLESEIAALKRIGTDKKSDDKNTPETKAFDRFLRRGVEALQADELKFLQSSNNADGGFIAPPSFQAELLRDVGNYSPMRELATVMATNAGTVDMPRRISGVTGSWVGENQDRPETQPVFGLNSYVTKEFACFVDVSNTILEDAAFDLQAMLRAEFAENLGEAEGIAFTAGDGVLSPRGFLNYPNVAQSSYVAGNLGYIATGASGAFVADPNGDKCLIDTYYALKPAYRRNATWVAAGSTIAAMKKMKATDGSPLIVGAGGLTGQPTDTLMGRPIVEFPAMPAMGANTMSIAFGDFRAGYRIFDRTALQVLRDPYSQAAKGRTRFHARRRVAGGLGVAEAIKLLKFGSS